MGCGLAAGKVAGRTTGLDGLGKVPGVGEGVGGRVIARLVGCLGVFYFGTVTEPISRD